jgi:hypothetical protein
MTMASFKLDLPRRVSAGLLVGAACLACAPASGAGAILRVGSAADPGGDAPVGLDLIGLRASYSRTRGALATTVPMNGRLSRSAVIVVAFGTRAPAGNCEVASGEEVVFSAGSEAATWAPLDAAGNPGRLGTTRIVPAASTTMSSGLTASMYRNKAWNCATVEVRGTSGAAADTAETSLSETANGLEPPTAGNQTVLQIDDQYGGVSYRTGRFVPVSVTCLVSPARRCAGQLTVTQQNTHVMLGRIHFTLPLGTSKIIRVPLHLTSKLKRLKTLYVVETLSPDHGRSTRTVTGVKYAN